MASTYSALKIELIATGEQVNVWGSTTNTNLGTALEQAIVGRTVASFTTDGNLTIDLTNTNSTQVARHYILNLTSTGTLTATRDLIVPSIDKPYIIENNTTGAQSIRVKTAAGTGITVPNGKTAMVYANSTNVVSAVSYIPAVTIDTATIAAGTATLSAATITTATINGGTITGITDLAVADGGTGLSTLTANNVILGNGASAPTFVAPGASGNLLTSNGTTWASTTPATTVSSFSAGTTGFTPSTTTTGAVTLSGTLAVANGGTGVTTSTGTTNVVLSNSPTLVSPSISSAVMSSMASSVITSGSVVSASGTTVSFTGIPSWAKRITLMFTALSTNGSSLVQVQLGTGSTTYETSGYSSSGAHIITNSTGIANSTSGMLIEAQGMGSGNSRQGLFTLGNLTGNVWTMSGCTGYSNIADMCLGGGSISLGATLTALRLTTTGGDSFDAGTVNIMYD